MTMTNTPTSFLKLLTRGLSCTTKNKDTQTFETREKGKTMRAELIFGCCGYKVMTCSKTYEYIDCFRLKRGAKFFKKYLPDGREVKKEILLVAFCPQCKHWILKFLWYANRSSRFQDWDFEKVIRGRQADDIFNRRQEFYNLIDIPNPFKPKKEGKHAKKIPWIYYKTLDSYSQIPRYLDESGDVGLKKVNKVKVN